MGQRRKGVVLNPEENWRELAGRPSDALGMAGGWGIENAQLVLKKIHQWWDNEISTIKNLWEYKVGIFQESSSCDIS